MQKTFEKIIERAKRAGDSCAMYFPPAKVISIEELEDVVNQIAKEYECDTNVGRTAWETVYKRISGLEREYFEAGDVKNSDELIKLSNLLRHYKEQLTEEAGDRRSDGWILSSERLPEEPETGMTYMENLPEYNVMIKGADVATTLHYAGDGEWYDCLSQAFYEVVAWQPLLKPYIPCDNTEVKCTCKTGYGKCIADMDALETRGGTIVCDMAEECGYDRGEILKRCEYAAVCREGG